MSAHLKLNLAINLPIERFKVSCHLPLKPEIRFCHFKSEQKEKKEIRGEITHASSATTEKVKRLEAEEGGGGEGGGGEGGGGGVSRSTCARALVITTTTNTVFFIITISFPPKAQPRFYPDHSTLLRTSHKHQQDDRGDRQQQHVQHKVQQHPCFADDAVAQPSLRPNVLDDALTVRVSDEGLLSQQQCSTQHKVMVHWGNF